MAADFAVSCPARKKDRRLYHLFPLFAVLVVLLLPCQVLAIRGMRAAILINLDTGKVLFEHKADMPIPPASLTKVMSLFLTLDAVKAKKLTLTERIRIPSAAATVGGSSMHLRVGERVPVRDLLTGAAVASGNDAITALALRVSGSQRRFVQAMNHKARKLGMQHSYFKNPSGLPAAGQRSCPRDMALLARTYLKVHPAALRYHATHALTHRKRFLPNTNTLLGVVPGVTGLKTGWTIASGYNIIVTAVRGKTRLLAVVMGGTSRKSRDSAATRILEAGFRHGTNIRQIYAALGYRIPPGHPRKSTITAQKPAAHVKDASNPLPRSKPPHLTSRPASPSYRQATQTARQRKVSSRAKATSHSLQKQKPKAHRKKAARVTQ